MEQLRFRKEIRRNEIADSRNKQVQGKMNQFYIEDLDKLIDQTHGQFAKQLESLRKFKGSLELQVASMNNIETRRANKLSTDDRHGTLTEQNEDFETMLADAADLINEKKLIAFQLEEKDSQHQSNLRRYQEKRTKIREQEDNPEDLTKFLRNAQMLIYDQELIEQQKKEINQQQSELLDKLAARKGRIRAKQKQEQEQLRQTETHVEKKKSEPLNPTTKKQVTMTTAGSEEEDLEQLVAKAKELMEDQN
jgi:hypothetical protein